jgi:hypothetical protein
LNLNQDTGYPECIFMAFLSFNRKMQAQYLQLGHGHFYPTVEPATFSDDMEVVSQAFNKIWCTTIVAFIALLQTESSNSLNNCIMIYFTGSQCRNFKDV